MKKILLFIYTLLGISSFSQNIYVTKRDYSVTPTIHSLQKLNQSTGNVETNYNYTSTFSSSYSPRNLAYNSQTNEIFGITGNTITKYNIITGLETSFNLPTLHDNIFDKIELKNVFLIITWP